MKSFLDPHPRQQGHAILLAVIIVGLIGFILVAYLTLVQSQNTAVMRSQAWNSSVPVIESGIEDALTHINTHGWTNLECDGWTRVNGDQYQVSRFVGESFYVVTITNYTEGSSNNTPTINSLAYVQMPTVVASSGQGPLLAQANAPASSVAYLGRGVRTTTGRDRIFVKGLVARDGINMNGNGVRTDSFDSSDPAWSTNGTYTSSRFKANGDIAVNGSVENGTGGSIDIGNANIYGRVATGPNGSISLGPNGAVGTAAWQAGNSGIQPGYSSKDMNVAFPEVTVPFAGGWTPSGAWITNIISTTITTNAGTTSTTIGFPSSPAGSVTTNYPVLSTNYPTGSPGPVSFAQVVNTTPSSKKATTGFPAAGTYVGTVTSNNVTTGNPANRGWYYNYNYITGYKTNWTYPTFTYTSGQTLNTNHVTSSTYYDYVLTGGDYTLTTLNGSVYVSDDSRLYVSSSLNLSGVTIKPGKRFDLYSNAASTSLAGNNTANSDGRATSFYIWGTSNVTSLTLSGNAGLTAAYYAPNATLTCNGGGNNTMDFIGAGIVRSVTMNGHFNFHYDEALGKFGPDRGWYITSWNEMTPNEIPRASVNGSGKIVFSSPNSSAGTDGN